MLLGQELKFKNKLCNLKLGTFFSALPGLGAFALSGRVGKTCESSVSDQSLAVPPFLRGKALPELETIPIRHHCRNQFRQPRCRNRRQWFHRR